MMNKSFGTNIIFFYRNSCWILSSSGKFQWHHTRHCQQGNVQCLRPLPLQGMKLCLSLVTTESPRYSAHGNTLLHVVTE